MRDERPWCGVAPPCAWYQFSVDRKGEHPSNHLAGYTGTVHADSFAGFNGLFGEGKADEQACMVHVRRKFVDEVGIEPSVGNVGDSYDNALAETINGLYKTELLHRQGPWRNMQHLEMATLGWVDWFNNRRLLGPIGNIPPAEAE